MKILGINSSPRIKGNSRYLMSVFMDQMKAKGNDTNVLDAVRLNIKHCIGCGNCEKKGECVFKEDDFTKLVLPALVEADVVVLCSPVYFYAFPAGVKALIDRVQVLWSRKYRLNTGEFKGGKRKGVLLAVGATKGEELFAGMEQTARYFFDAADMKYHGSLCYHGVDEKDEIKDHSDIHADVGLLASGLLKG